MPLSPTKLVLVDVDTQVDFVLPHGNLYVPGAEKLIPQWERLMKFAQQHHIPVISSADAHAPDDREFQQFPPHCVRGTSGQQKITATLLPDRRIVPNEPNAVARDSAAQQWVLEKQALDLFTNANATRLVEKLAAAEYIVFGVATDYCVKAAAEGLLNMGRRVAVVTDAIEGIDPAGSRATLEQLQQRGARLVTTDEVLSQAIAA